MAQTITFSVAFNGSMKSHYIAWHGMVLLHCTVQHIRLRLSSSMHKRSDTIRVRRIDVLFIKSKLIMHTYIQTYHALCNEVGSYEWLCELSRNVQSIEPYCILLFIQDILRINNNTPWRSVRFGSAPFFTSNTTISRCPCLHMV